MDVGAVAVAAAIAAGVRPRCLSDLRAGRNLPAVYVDSAQACRVSLKEPL
jgi:hypothetical protein